MTTQSRTGLLTCLALRTTGLLTRSGLEDGAGDAAYVPRWHFYAAAIVVGLVFFLTEHNLHLSLAEAYTQTIEEMELTAAGGNVLRRLALVSLAGLGAILFAIGRAPLRMNPWLAVPLASYLLIAAASCLWAVDFPICVRRLIVLACATVGAAGIARRFSMRELCQFALAVVAPLVAIGLLSELCLGTFRPWSGDYRFAGSVHPNTQGAYCTILALGTLGLARSICRWQAVLWLLFAASLALVLLTKSRTGCLALLLAIGSVLAVQVPVRKQLLAAFGGVWISAGLSWLLMACGYDPLTDFRDAILLGRTSQADTLSGRAFIWPLVAHYASQRAWLGYGYESFWNPAHIQLLSDELGWGIREAHSGYLDVLLSTGLIGLACGVAAATTGLFVAIRGALRNPAYALPLGLLIFGLTSSWMESGMVTVMLPSFLAGCCLLRMSLYETPVPMPTATDK